MWGEIAIGVFTLAILVGVVAVRSFSAGRIEVTLNDAIITTIAAGLMLFVTGRVGKVSIGSGGVSLETASQAILSASAAIYLILELGLPFGGLMQVSPETLRTTLKPLG